MDHVVVDWVVVLHEDEEGVVVEEVRSGLHRHLFHVVCEEVMEVIQCQAHRFQGVVVVVEVMEWCKIHSSLDRGTCQERAIQTTSP